MNNPATAMAMPEDGTLHSDVERILLAEASVRTFASGQRVFDLGSSPAGMFGILSGSVRVSLEPIHRSERLSLLLAKGQWFGEVPLLDERARAFSAVAHEPARIAVVSAASFHRAIDRNPAVLLAIARLVCSRYRQALDWIEANEARSLQQRLATLLLTLHPGLRMPQSALADRLGVSRPTVNRLLKAWQSAGWIVVGYGSVTVLDLHAVRSLTSDAGKPDMRNHRARPSSMITGSS